MPLYVPARRRFALLGRRRKANFQPRLERLENRDVPVGGALDPTFGTGGIVNFDFEWSDRAYAAALQSDGKIILAGSRNAHTVSDFALARFHTDGSLDGSFGNNGRVITDMGGGSDTVFDVAVQPDGKIVAVGAGTSQGRNAFAVARYQPSGSPDPSFGTDGRVTTSILTGSTAFAVLVLPDGKLIVAGNSQPTVGLSTAYFTLVR